MLRTREREAARERANTCQFFGACHRGRLPNPSSQFNQQLVTPRESCRRRCYCCCCCSCLDLLMGTIDLSSGLSACFFFHFFPLLLLYFCVFLRIFLCLNLTYFPVFEFSLIFRLVHCIVVRCQKDFVGACENVCST